MDITDLKASPMEVVRSNLTSCGIDNSNVDQKCIAALNAYMIEDKNNSPCVVALVQRNSSKQCAIFIYSQSTDLEPNKLLINYIIALDENFRSAIELPNRISIVGQSLADMYATSQSFSNNHILCKNLHLNNPNFHDQKLPLHSQNLSAFALSTPSTSNRDFNSSDIDSDDENETNQQTIYLKNTQPQQSSKVKPKKILLEFLSFAQAKSFHDKLITHNWEMQSKLNLHNSNLVAGDQISFELGKEALNSLITYEYDPWFKAYQVELNKLVNLNKQKSCSVSDLNGLNVSNRLDKIFVNSISSHSETNSSLSSLCSTSPNISNTTTATTTTTTTTHTTNANTTTTTTTTNDNNKIKKKKIIHKLSIKSNNNVHSSVKLRHSKSSSAIYSSNLHRHGFNLDNGVEAESNFDQFNSNCSNTPSNLTKIPTQSCASIPRSSFNFNGYLNRKPKEYLDPRIFRQRFREAGDAIQKQLLEHIDDYSKIEPIRVFIGSWNVNGRQDINRQLDDWLLPPEGQPPADIYVFGFQEMDLSLSVITLNKTNPSGPEENWIQLLENALGGLLKRPSTNLKLFPNQINHVNNNNNNDNNNNNRKTFANEWLHHTGGGYMRVNRVRLAGIMMIAYISARLFSYIRRDEVSIQVVPTGIFNVMGNKGAVGLRLSIFNSSICFVNCHLAAGEANLDRRNQDYKEILRKMIFDVPIITKNSTPAVEKAMIFDHDVAFIFGDLNYRISGLDSATVRKYIFQRDFQPLIERDELVKQYENHKAFDHFCEHVIKFAPTYKFDANSNVYDSSEKNRIPSYCDRILWYGKICEPIAYRSHPVFTISDHKPVSAYFVIQTRLIKTKEFKQTYESVLLSIDLTTNISLPKAQLDRQELNFSNVHFNELCTQNLTLKNIGLTSFRFDFPHEGIGSPPSWLTILPAKGEVKPDSSVVIDFQIFVTCREVCAMNSGTILLNTILILHLKGGKDYFITIEGQFIPTSFGLPLQLLLTMRSDPVSNFPIKELQEQITAARAQGSDYFKSKLDGLTDQHPFHVPKEIFRLVGFINEHIMEPDLFCQSGISSEMGIIRELIDTTPPQCPFPDTISVHSVVSCLILFLSTLPEPVIPSQYQNLCINSSDSFDQAMQAIQHLPISNQNLFFYLLTFLQRCLEFNDQNGTNIDLLAQIFGDTFFHEFIHPEVSAKHRQTIYVKQIKQATFVRAFLLRDKMPKTNNNSVHNSNSGGYNNNNDHNNY